MVKQQAKYVQSECKQMRKLRTLFEFKQFDKKSLQFQQATHFPTKEAPSQKNVEVTRTKN